MKTKTRWSRRLSSMGVATLVVSLSQAGCYDEDTAAVSGDVPSRGPGFGVDPAVAEVCLGCHGEIRERFQRSSSHEQLFDCNGCHALGLSVPHEEPIHLPSCATCHSEKTHANGAGCTECHDPHGSSNLFLIRTSIDLPQGGTASIDYTALAGAEKGGLARAGVVGEEAGTGLCEVCHTSTKHYNAAGTGAPHPAAWCGDCHDHQASFAPSAPVP